MLLAKQLKNFLNKIIMKWQWMLIALVSGAFLPIQAGLNTKLGKTIESPVYASLVSFAVGVIALTLFVILTKQEIAWNGFKSAPSYVWLGGILGAFYVTAIILSFPSSQRHSTRRQEEI